MQNALAEVFGFSEDNEDGRLLGEYALLSWVIIRATEDLKKRSGHRFLSAAIFFFSTPATSHFEGIVTALGLNAERVRDEMLGVLEERNIDIKEVFDNIRKRRMTVGKIVQGIDAYHSSQERKVYVVPRV